MEQQLITPLVRELDRRIADLYFGYEGSYRWETELALPEDSAHRGRLSALAALRRRVQVGPLHPFWQRHFSEALLSLETQLKLDWDRPYKYINRLTSAIDRLTFTDARPAPDRSALLLAKVQRGPALLSTAASLLSRRSSAVRQEASDSARVLARGAERAAAYWQVESPGTLVRLLADLQPAARSLSHRLPREEGAEVEPALAYQDLLEKGYGLSLAEVASWREDALDQERAALRELGRQLDPRRTAPQLLREDLGAYATPGEMFAAMEHYVAHARRESLRYVQLPAGETCTVEPMPETGKATSPWGAYYGGDVLRGDLRGRIVLHDDNFRQVTRGWLEMMAVHECYPGHHAHRVKTAASSLPETFKCGYLASAVITEGIAHRSETLLRDIFPEAAYPLFVQYRRVHTTARILVEWELYVHQRPLDQVYPIYCREMELDEATARAQTRAHLLLPGAHVTYYSGLRELERLQKELGWDEARFTEATFAHGFISAGTLRQLLGLTEGERQEIRNFAAG